MYFTITGRKQGLDLQTRIARVCRDSNPVIQAIEFISVFSHTSPYGSSSKGLVDIAEISNCDDFSLR